MRGEVAVADREVGDAAEIDVLPEGLVGQRVDQVEQRAEEEDVEGHGEGEAPGLLAIAPEPVLQLRAEPAPPRTIAEVSAALESLLEVGELACVAEISHRHRI